MELNCQNIILVASDFRNGVVFTTSQIINYMSKTLKLANWDVTQEMEGN